MPALPLDDAGTYVAGAYVAFVALLLVYVAIMAAKLQRIQREIRSLAELAEAPQNRRDHGRLREREQQMDSVREGAQR